MLNRHWDSEFEQACVCGMLIPFICEHTGLSQQQVETFLDAQNAFWESHPRLIAYFMGQITRDELDA